MRSRNGTITPPKFLGIDVLRTRSNESTEVANSSIKMARNPPSSPKQEPGRDDQSWRMIDQSWRMKDTSSIFRSSPSKSSLPEVPDMFSINRCNAFDEDD